MPHDVLSRREFIRRSAVGAVGAGVALGGSGAFAQEAPQPEERNKRDTMRYRVLGHTNLLVSELSMGGQFLTAGVFAAALDKGVNLLHVSVEYPGCYEEAAKVLKDRRDEVFLGIKGRPGLGSFREVDGWLRALDTDHADFVFLPTISPDEARDADGRVRQQFEALKAAGKARFLGITCHNEVFAVAQAAVEAGHWDAIMPRYGAPFRADLEPILTQAKERNIGVIAMKSLQAGGGRRNWTTAFQTALDHPGVTTVLKGLPDYDILNELSGAVMTRPGTSTSGRPSRGGP
jgi:predicted aldo/keto reductase-like oxidoreductase